MQFTFFLLYKINVIGDNCPITGKIFASMNFSAVITFLKIYVVIE